MLLLLSLLAPTYLLIIDIVWSSCLLCIYSQYHIEVFFWAEARFLLGLRARVFLNRYQREISLRTS